MHIDRYTKIVLTVIAACLLWDVAHDLLTSPPASAQAGATPVRVTDHSLSTLRPIPVRIMN